MKNRNLIPQTAVLRVFATYQGVKPGPSPPRLADRARRPLAAIIPDPGRERFPQATRRVFGCIGQGGYHGCLRQEGQVHERLLASAGV
jgi:hypothetical protein